MTPKVSIRRALSDPGLLGDVLGGDTWSTWRTLLIAAMGEPLTPAERPIFERVTGRAQPPPQRVEELLAIVGRRGGKSRTMSALACYLAGLCDHRDKLVRGERGVLLLIAPDQRQAKIDLEYVAGTLESTPILKQLVASRTADTIELTNGINIEVRAASFRRLRGVTAIAVLADESCFFYSDDGGSQNADSAIFDAVRPSLATTGGPLIIISSPHARRGATWEIYRKHFGREGDPLILVARGPSRTFNPALPQAVVDRALARDHAAASAEYMAEWRTDLAEFVPFEIVNACVEMGVHERGRLPACRYVAYTDPSGGSSDSFTLAIGHREGEVGVLDVVREVRAPFSPESVVEEFAQTLKNFGVSRVKGDRYAGMWPAEQFGKRHISYEPAEKNTSETYLAFLPLLNSKRVRLLDNQRLTQQLCGLERRTSRGNKDSVGHTPGAHDDVATAVAGCMVALIDDKYARYTWGIMNNVS